MPGAEQSLPAIFIRLVAIIIVLSLYQYWPVSVFGIELLDQFIYRYRYEEIMGVDFISAGLGILNIVVWLLGLLTAITLFLLKSYSRWLLLAYFVIGLVPAQISWIPYTGSMMTLFENPYIKIISPEILNLLIVVLTFILFRKLTPIKRAA